MRCVRPFGPAALLALAFLLPVPTAAEEEPWFTDVAVSAGLAGVGAKRTKLLDFTGDGWPDALIMSQDGAEWMARAYADDDETPLAERKAAARAHRFSLLRSTPGTDGGRRFEDVTEASGLFCERPYHLAVAADVDDDGDLDLFCSGYAAQEPSDRIETPSFVLLNDGRGRFVPFDQKLPAAPDEPAGPNHHLTTVCGATFADVDDDGRLDLFLGSWYRHWGGDLKLYAAYPDRLYLGLGAGRFADATERLGLAQLPGILDTLPEEDRAAQRVRPETRARLGRGAAKPTYGTAAADWDDDGDADLFSLSYGRQWNHHWRNDAEAGFVEVGQESRFDGDEDESGTYPSEFHPKGRRAEFPFRGNGNSFDCTFGDYDNDGDLDCVVSEYTHAWAGPSSDVTRILTNTGADGGYRFERRLELERVHTRRNWNQGDLCTAFADVDNDGWLDLLISSCVYPDHNVLELFHQEPGSGNFRRVTNAVGLEWPDSTQISLADYDRDGDVDILAGRMPHPSRADRLECRVALWRNDVANRRGHHFLSVWLEGKGPPDGANRMAVGARVRVTAGGITQTREVTAGRGHVGHQDDTRLVFGLGRTRRIETLEVRWPGRAKRIDRFHDLSADRFLRIREGGRPLPEKTR